MELIAHHLVTIARQLVQKEYHKKAFDIYLLAFEKHPDIKKDVEPEFREVLTKINYDLAAVDNRVDIFSNFIKAIKEFPGNVALLNDIGKILYSYGYFGEALCHFEKALNIDKSCVNIEKNLNNAKCFLFSRSLFRALNDRVRNEAYRAAIQQCITPFTDSVLDADTGSGLLAIYANERNPIAITACESSTTLARLAECIMGENRIDDVVIINKPSVMLNQMDIYGTRSVLLTDAIDAGLFGEYILQSLCHAWEYLLYKNSKVIPARAEYFVVGAECDELNRKYQLCSSTKNLLNVPEMNVHTTTHFGETYYSDDVNLFDNLKYITEPQKLFEIKFNSYEDVRNKLYRQEPYNAEFTAKEDGQINTVIGWFNLYLTEDIMITNDPRREDRAMAWQQAVFFDLIPRPMKQNASCYVQFLTYGGRLTTLPDMYNYITRISPETLTFLNDIEYMNMISACIPTVCIYLGQTEDISVSDIVDLSPFPVFGILMLIRGAQSLICHAKTNEDKLFLEAVLRTNNIALDKVSVLIGELSIHADFIDDDDKKFNAIFCSAIDLSGEIDIRRKNIGHELKYGHLKQGGLFLPAKLSIMGQLVSSDWLDLNNRVYDENVSNYRMSRYVNRYQVTQAAYLDLARLEHTALSDPFQIIQFSYYMVSQAVRATITQDGECNAILCWYEIQLLDGWDVISTKRKNSCVEGIASLVNPKVKVFCEDTVFVLRCMDDDGSMKLVLDDVC